MFKSYFVYILGFFKIVFGLQIWTFWSYLGNNVQFLWDVHPPVEERQLDFSSRKSHNSFAKKPESLHDVFPGALHYVFYYFRDPFQLQGADTRKKCCLLHWSLFHPNAPRIINTPRESSSLTANPLTARLVAIDGLMLGWTNRPVRAHSSWIRVKFLGCEIAADLAAFLLALNSSNGRGSTFLIDNSWTWL